MCQMLFLALVILQCTTKIDKITDSLTPFFSGGGDM